MTKVPIKKPATRTQRQNRALHLYFRMLADELNSGGYNVQVVLAKKMDVDWTPALVKDILWRTAQQAIYKKDSTTKLRKAEEIDTIYHHLNRYLGQYFGVSVEFPSYERDEYERTTAS